MHKVGISVRVFPCEKAALEKLAEQRDESVDRIVRIMIRESLSKCFNEDTKMETAAT
jgi:hypothetical protein